MHVSSLLRNASIVLFSFHFGKDFRSVTLRNDWTCQMLLSKHMNLPFVINDNHIELSNRFKSGLFSGHRSFCNHCEVRIIFFAYFFLWVELVVMKDVISIILFWGHCFLPTRFFTLVDCCSLVSINKQISNV